MSLPPSKRVKGPRKPVRGLGYLPDVVKVRKPMRATRKDVRPGNRPITEAEWAIIERAKTGGCLPCMIRAAQGKMDRDRVFKFAGWDHAKSGNIRRGHLQGFASCNWHHQGLIIDLPGWQRADFEREYGPSKHYGTGPFHEAFGTDDELIAMQEEVLAGRWSR